MRRHAKASSATSNARKGTRARFAVMAVLTSVLAALVAFAALASAEPVATEHYASFGPDGTEATDFQRVLGVAVDQQTGVVYVLDKDGTLQKFEADGTPLDFTGSNPDIVEGKITGLDVYTEGNPTQVSVDSTNHRIYVIEKTAIRAFEADGEPAKFTEGPGAGTNAIPGFLEPGGVAVDADGAIYASNCAFGEFFTTECDSGSVRIYSPTGAPLKTLAVAKPTNLAVASDGVLYVGESAFVLKKLIPSEFPVTPATTYTDGGSIEVSGATEVSGVAVDPLSDDIFILEIGGVPRGSIRQFDKEGHLLRTIAKSGGIGELGNASRGIAVVAGGEEFQLYVGDSEEIGGEVLYSKVAIFGEEVNEGPPTIRGTSAIDVTADSATLRTQVNPNTAATTYRFEYGTEPCASGTCTKVPLGDGQIPAGHRFVSVPSEQLLGLAASTTYHYRVVAENSFDPPTEGPEHTFTTQAFGLGFQLSDSRAWEMVSPTNKHGARLGAPTAGQVFRAAEDGSGFAYATLGSIEADPEGNRAVEGAYVLSRRGSGGWQSKDITPPHTEPTIVTVAYSEYQLFSSDLGRALVMPGDGTLLSPQASERTPYLRENTESADYIPLLTSKEGFANVPPGTEFGSGNGGNRSAAFVFGATQDLSHIVLTSDVPLIAGAPAKALYEWHEGGLHAVSKLPAGEGGGWVEELGYSPLGSQGASVQNAISDDGSRVFWSRGVYGPGTNGLIALYLRDLETEETARLDLKQPGASGLGEVKPVFQGASADGTVAFFTDSQQLTADASPKGRDLYRCEIPSGQIAAGCATLTDLTPAPGPGESADLLGLASGLGEDGKTISFVARGVLDSSPNSLGDTAVAGEPNLYRWQEGEGTSFVATLAEKDRRDWGGDTDSAGSSNFLATSLVPASSPSGRYFSFMSQRSLSGEDNLDAVTEEPVQQVFLYDTASEELRCVSCALSGASPHGRELPEGGNSRVDPLGKWSRGRLAASLPEPTATGGADISNTFYPLFRPRAVLDNGRLFFNSVDSLVSGDSNGQWDVYQYEPTGVGSCTEESEGPAVVSSELACVSLLSSGTATEEAAFLDASESGDDVFFTTPAKLSVLDEDTIDDVYDARVNGIVARRPVLSECLGEACQAAPNPPNDPTPASAAFKGSGNVPSERCPQGKRRVMRSGHPRCVAKKHRKKRSHKAKRAASNRRAGR